MAGIESNVKEKRRGSGKASVYDAVAGRVGYESFLSNHNLRLPKHNDPGTARTSTPAVPPDEVLFRRKNAPVRYEENDIYAADRHLKPAQRLPESDLLKALHAYASDFYPSGPGSHGPASDFRSLDETALLALGILLEEAAQEAIGKDGDLAFVDEPDSSRFMPSNDGR